MSINHCRVSKRLCCRFSLSFEPYVYLSNDDFILALPVFPSWKCEDQHTGAQGTVEWTVIWDLRIASNPSHPNTDPFFSLPDHLFCSISSVLAYQQPNAKKLRRIAQRAEQLAAKGVVTRRQRQLLRTQPVAKKAKKAETEANNNPKRDYYDIWGPESECCFFFCLFFSGDDPILALTVFPSWKCEEHHNLRWLMWSNIWDLRKRWHHETQCL